MITPSSSIKSGFLSNFSCIVSINSFDSSKIRKCGRSNILNLDCNRISINSKPQTSNRLFFPYDGVIIIRFSS